MKILEPVLVPDVSIWCDHINPNEFEDGGCGSVVVGLYPVPDNKGGKVLSPISRQQCIDVATKSSMVLQAYFWDDITLNPIEQADWVIQTIKSEGLPIKWIWADQEQWWQNWTAWHKARGGLIPWSEVPKGVPANISSHYEKFIIQLHSQIPESGVYTNKGFVTSYAPKMDSWLPKYRSWVPHYGRQPKETTQMTWAQLKENWLPNYELILAAGQKPELVAGHQFTGYGCKLPGSYDKKGGMLVLDVSVFSKAFIDEIRGIVPSQAPTTATTQVSDPSPAQDPSSPPNPTPVPTPVSPSTPSPISINQPATVDYVVQYARINVRAGPDSGSAWVRFAVKDEILPVVKVENGWALISDGTYVFAGFLSKKPVDTQNPIANAPVIPQPATDNYVVLYARINVRARADSNSTWKRFAVKDEVLHVVKIENSWAQLLDGTYVFAGYIRKV
jgi:hypothetical protein